MQNNQLDLDRYSEELTKYLLKLATGAGYLDGELLSSPDIDDAWLGYSAEFYADASKAERVLHWHTEKTVEDMCRDSWNWEQKGAGKAQK